MGLRETEKGWLGSGEEFHVKEGIRTLLATILSILERGTEREGGGWTQW